MKRSTNKRQYFGSVADFSKNIKFPTLHVVAETDHQSYRGHTYQYHIFFSTKKVLFWNGIFFIFQKINILYKVLVSNIFQLVQLCQCLCVFFPSFFYLYIFVVRDRYHLTFFNFSCCKFSVFAILPFLFVSAVTFLIFSYFCLSSYRYFQ